MTLAPRCACQANPPRRTLRSSWCSSVAASPCGDGVAGAAIDRIVNRRPASCLLASRSPACGRAMFLSAVRLSCGRRAASCGGSFCLSQSRPSRSVHAPGPRRTTRRQTGQNRLQVACSSNAPPKSPQKLKVAGWTGSDSELRALAYVEEKMRGYKYGQPSTETCKWFLRDRNFDVDEAVKKLQSMLQWRKEFRADEITDEMVAAEVATGKAVVWDFTDNFGQPVVLVRADRHVIGEVPLDDSKRMCVHVLDKAQQLAISSGSETMLGIFDLSKFKSRNADISFVMFLIEAFIFYYPKRLTQVLFVDAPWVFQPVWTVIKPMLRKYGALVRFASSADVRDEYFTQETCPPEFK